MACDAFALPLEICGIRKGPALATIGIGKTVLDTAYAVFLDTQTLRRSTIL